MYSIYEFYFFISVKHGSKVVFCANNGKYNIVITLLHTFLHHLQPILTITIKYCTMKTGEYQASIIFSQGKHGNITV